MQYGREHLTRRRLYRLYIYEMRHAGQNSSSKPLCPLGGKLNIRRHLETARDIFFTHQNQRIICSKVIKKCSTSSFSEVGIYDNIFFFHFTYLENVINYDATFRRPTITDEFPLDKQKRK